MRTKTVKLKLILSDVEKQTVRSTIKEYSSAFNFFSRWSDSNNSISKTVAHKQTYLQTKELFKSLPTGLIQSARDMALEACKNKKRKSIPNKKHNSSIRYDARTFSIRNKQLTFSSIDKRIKTIISIPEYAKPVFDGWNMKKTGYLSVSKENIYFTFIFEKEENLLKNDSFGKIVGLDRGIINTIATSEGELYKGQEIRANKRKFLYLKKKLQSKGTHSSNRVLKLIRGKEKRFSAQQLHSLSKKLSSKTDVKTYVLENLTKIKSKKYNKKSNKIVSNWGFKQFENYLIYKCLGSGIQVHFVDARFTSQICSGCGNTDKSARNKGIYRCVVCKCRIHADINAAINIRQRFLTSQFSSIEQGSVNNPHVSELRNSDLTSSQASPVSS